MKGKLLVVISLFLLWPRIADCTQVLYVGEILDAKCEVSGAGQVDCFVICGLKSKLKTPTAEFSIKLKNCDLAMIPRRGGISKDAKGVWKNGFYIGLVNPPKERYMFFSPMMKGTLMENPVVSESGEKYYAYRGTAHGEILSTVWPRTIFEREPQGRGRVQKVMVGSLEPPGDTTWYRQEQITINFGTIQNAISDSVGLYSGEHFRRVGNGYNDKATFTVYVPDLEKVEESLKNRFRKLSISAHDIDTFMDLEVEFQWKTRWNSEEKILATMLGTKDTNILALSKELFPDFTRFRSCRSTSSRLHLLLPTGEPVKVRIVKEGYYYLSRTFKLSEDTEKEALLDRVGKEVQKDGGNRGRIE